MWSRTPPTYTDIGGELRRIAQQRAPAAAPSVLLKWLESWGERWAGEQIGPDTATRWLCVLSDQREASRKHKVPGHVAGPSARWAAPNPQHIVGRAAYKPRYTFKGLRSASGELVTSPSKVEDILWQPWQNIWTQVPDEGPCSDKLFEAYFADPVRRAELAAGDSAPGVDNVPYEVLHVGMFSVSHLLGQAFHGAALGGDWLLNILGANVDLLAWISKKEDADSADDQWPLQLFSTFRRLYGAALMALVGPAVEPKLCPAQAAVKGGSCAKNIRLAYQHLAVAPRAREPRDNNMWTAILGPAADACTRVCAACYRPGVDR